MDDDDQNFEPYTNKNAFERKATATTQSLFSSLMLDDESINPFAGTSPWNDSKEDTESVVYAPESKEQSPSNSKFGLNNPETYMIDESKRPSIEQNSPEDIGVWGDSEFKTKATPKELTGNKQEHDQAPSDQTYFASVTANEQNTSPQTVGSSRRPPPPRNRTVLSQRTKAALDATAKKSGTNFVDPLTSAAKDAEDDNAGLPTTIPSGSPLSSIDEANNSRRIAVTAKGSNQKPISTSLQT